MPDTSDINATLVTRVKHECDTSATQVKHFDFDNDTSKNIFSRPYIYYMAGERLQEEEQFHTSFPCQNAFEKCNKKTELF